MSRNLYKIKEESEKSSTLKKSKNVEDKKERDNYKYNADTPPRPDICD